MNLSSFKRKTLGICGTILGRPALGKPFRRMIENWNVISTVPPRLRKRRTSPFQILVYHRVLPQHEPFAIDVISVKDFEQHLQMFSAICRLITMEQLVRELETDTVRPHTFCITFDDGYRDNFDYAFPLLQKYGVPATVFLTTDFIGTDTQLWHDSVLFAFQNANVNRLSFEEADLIDVDLTNIHSRHEAAFKFLNWLKQFDPVIRDRHIQQLFRVCPFARANRERIMLDWNEVKQMLKGGISFGAHTKTHPILSRLNEESMEEEISGSKLAVENALGTSISTFAYPNGKIGDYDARSKSILEKANYRCAVTACVGVNTSDRDRFELFRTMPWDRDPTRLLGRLLYERLTN